MPYEIKIIAHQIKDGKVIYTIETFDTRNDNSKTTKYRYSQLKEIHQELQNIVDKLQLPVNLPEFPSRKLFGVTNKSENAILERKRQLNHYLSNLIPLQKLYNLQTFKKSFLPNSSKERGEQLKPQDSIFNFQMFIDRYTIVENVVLYYARMRDLNTQDEWIFRYRYSDFRNLHDALQKSKIKQLPQFPKRKLFGITNGSPQDIQKRREELEIYFNQIFVAKELADNQIIKFFVENTKKQAEKDFLYDRIKKDTKKVS